MFNLGEGWGFVSHICFDLSLDTRQLLLVRNIALVVGDTPRLTIFHLPHIQHRNRGATHPVDLSDEQTKAASSTSYDDDLIIEVDLTRQTKSYAPIDLSQSPADCDCRRVPYRDPDWYLLPVHVLGAEAQRDHPGDEGMEEGDIEDLQEEVDGERRKPGVALRRLLEGTAVCHYDE